MRERLPNINVSPETQAMFAEGATLLIDKPLHWTSFDVVRKIRGAIRIKKVGHAGTLDPLATGLLIVCTGRHTKRIADLMGAEKEYTGTFTLGATTPTYDLESQPENECAVPPLSHAALQEVADSFLGSQMQVPPIYSAIKKDGTALYELARRGTDIALEPRRVDISQFEITEVLLPVVGFRVRVSSGTYIRSLAHDFGRRLQCGAHLSSLRRTHIGLFPVTASVTLAQFLEDAAAGLVTSH